MTATPLSPLPSDQPQVGVSLPHEAAHLHVAGRAPYVDDLPESAGTLHAALGLSPIAHGKLLGIDLARLRALPGVVAVLTAADIPGPNDCGPIVHDDPILCDGTLRHVGQPVFAVIATTREAARRAAALAKDVIHAEPLPAMLTPAQAHAAQAYVVPPMHLARSQGPGGRRGRARRVGCRTAPAAQRLQPRRPGAVLPRRANQLRHPDGGPGAARALLHPAPERDAAFDCARHSAGRPTRCR